MGGARDRVGSRIGKYEIINRIAVGGMAELFVARTRAAHGFEKIVALKRIFPHFLEDDDFVEMFLHEARLAAQLQHPNVAQVYDIGDDDGVYFFTMEYVLGQDVRRIVRAIRAREQWLTLDQIVTIVAQTAAGLHYAHEREDSKGRPLGIVHRDISPSNIIVSYDGGVKLVDFGIARATTRRNVTQTGVLKGKIPYMSPEQCRGEALDRRSDIYSLGVVLWELALCRRLWIGDSDLELAKRIASEAPPRPTAFLPNFPADLEAIIMKAVALDRYDRYATAQELQLDLEEFARERKLALSSIGLAQFMQDLFAEAIKGQKAALVEAKAGKRTLFPTVDSSGTTAPTVDAETTLVDTGAAPSVTEPPRRRSWAWAWAAAGALTLMSAAGAGVYWWLTSEQDAPALASAPAAAPSDTASPSATPPAAGEGTPSATSSQPLTGAPDAADAEQSAELQPSAGTGVSAETSAEADTDIPPQERPRARRNKRRAKRRAQSEGASAPADGEIKNPFAR